MKPINRRKFVGAAGTAIAASILAPGIAAEAPSNTVNVGLIGLGSRGTTHLKTLLGLPGVRVRAVCDLLPDRVAKAQQAVTDAGQAKPLGAASWKQLLELKELDAVASALPVDVHLACYLDALAAGKDLYAEKPMCLTLAECDALIAAAKKTDRKVQIGFQRRADPRFIEPMKLVHAGELGTLLEGRINWSISWGPLYDWFGKRERSGDWMVEQAVHNWDIMNWANRCRPKRAMGLGLNRFFKDKQADRNVHDYYAGVLEYENGVIVNIIHSWLAPKRLDKEFTWLIGSLGGVDFNTGMFSFRPDLNKEDRPAFEFDGSQIDSTKLAFEAFLKSVRTRSPSIAPPEIGREAVLTCLLMREAVYRQRPVTLNELSV